jgi:hypothetical protein
MLMSQELWFIRKHNHNPLVKYKLLMLHKINLKIKLKLQKQKNNLTSNKLSMLMELLILLIILNQLQQWHNQFKTQIKLKWLNKKQKLFLLMSNKHLRMILPIQMMELYHIKLMNLSQLQQKISKLALKILSRGTKKQLNLQSHSKLKT